MSDTDPTLYSLSQARLYEVLCGICEPDPDGTPISGVYEIDKEGSRPTIVMDRATAEQINGGQSWLDVVHDPEIVRVRHDRDANTLYVEKGEHLRGEKTTVAYVDKEFPPGPQHLAVVRGAMARMQLAMKRSPLPGLPGGQALP